MWACRVLQVVSQNARLRTLHLVTSHASSQQLSLSTHKMEEISESLSEKLDLSLGHSKNLTEIENRTDETPEKRFSIPGMIEDEPAVSKAPQSGCIPKQERKASLHLQPSVQNNGLYQNPWATWRPIKLFNVIKFMVSKDRSSIPNKLELDIMLPIMKPNFTEIETPPENGIRVTWIGHATTLVQFDGVSILTDPIFSSRASPSQIVGPKRYRNPPCSIDELPELDAVVISHNHYDHLDASSVTQLNNRFGPKLRWFVPMGVATWMHEMECQNVVELDWWETSTISGEKSTFVAFTPAQHWSKRKIGDDYETLWGSWCVIGPRYRFFFAGDTGYCDAFKQIGQKFGPFDLSAIPIGAYEPRWFMKYQHVNPNDAVQIHEDVSSKHSVAIHWGTFALANEYYLDPKTDLKESLRGRNLTKDQFFTLMHGETKLLCDTEPTADPE